MLTSWLKTPLRERESSKQATPVTQAVESAPSDAVAAAKPPAGDGKGTDATSRAEAAIEACGSDGATPKRKLDLSAAPGDKKDQEAAVEAPADDGKGADTESPAGAAVEAGSSDGATPKRTLDLSAAPAEKVDKKDKEDRNAQSKARPRRSAARKAKAAKAPDAAPSKEHPELVAVRRRVASLLEEARASALHPGYGSHASTAELVEAAVKAQVPSALDWGEGGPQLPSAYLAPLTCLVCESQEPLSTVAAAATERFVAACAGDGAAAAESARVVLQEAVKKAVPAVAQRKRWGLPGKLARALGRAPGASEDEDADEAGAAAWCWEPVTPQLLPKGSAVYYKARKAVRQRTSMLLSSLGAWQQLLEKAPAQEVEAAEEAETATGPAPPTDDGAVSAWRGKAEKARARVKRCEADLEAAKGKLEERVKGEEEKARRREAQARVREEAAKEKQREKEAKRAEQQAAKEAKEAKRAEREHAKEAKEAKRPQAKAEKGKPPQGVKPIFAFFKAPAPAAPAPVAAESGSAAASGVAHGADGGAGSAGAGAGRSGAPFAPSSARPSAPPAVTDPYAGPAPPLEEAAALWRRSRAQLDEWASRRRLRRAHRLLRGAVGPEVDVLSMMRAADKARPRAPTTVERVAQRRAAAEAANPFLAGGGGAAAPGAGVGAGPGAEGGGDAMPMVSGVPVCVLTRRRKLLQFHDNFRPPYFGTHGVRSPAVSGRRPFARDPTLDYDVDSDEEWEGEEEEGESLSADEGEEEGGDRDGLDYEDGFLCADNVVEYSQEADGGAVTVALTHGAEAMPGRGKAAKHSPTALAKHAAVYGPFLSAGVPAAAKAEGEGCDVAGVVAPCKELAGFRVHILAPQPEPWTPEQPPASLEGMWARVEATEAPAGSATTASTSTATAATAAAVPALPGVAPWQKSLRLVTSPPAHVASRAVLGALCPMMEPAAGTLASSLWLRSGRRRRAARPSAGAGAAATAASGVDSMAPEALAMLVRLLHGQPTGKERVVKAVKEAHPGHTKRLLMRVVDEVAQKADPPKGALSRKKRWIVRPDVLREHAPELLEAPAVVETAAAATAGADKAPEQGGGDAAAAGTAGDPASRKRKRIQPVLLQPSTGPSSGAQQQQQEEKEEKEAAQPASKAVDPSPSPARKRRARIAPTLVTAPAAAQPPAGSGGAVDDGDDMPASSRPHAAQPAAAGEGSAPAMPPGQRPLLAFFKQAAPAGQPAAKPSRKRSAPAAAAAGTGAAAAAAGEGEPGDESLPPAKKHSSAGPAEGAAAASGNGAEAEEAPAQGEEERESVEEVATAVAALVGKRMGGEAAALLRRTVLDSSWPHTGAVAFAAPSLFNALLKMAGARKAAATDRATAFKALAHALSLCTPGVAAQADASGEQGSRLCGARRVLALAPVTALTGSCKALCKALGEAAGQSSNPQRTTLTRSALRAGAMALEVLRTVLEGAGGEGELVHEAEPGVAEAYAALLALGEAVAATLLPVLPPTLRHANLGIRSFAASALESALRGPERVRAAVSGSVEVAAAAVAQCCPTLAQLSVEAVEARAAAAAKAEEERAKRSISRFFGGSGAAARVLPPGGEAYCSAAEDTGARSEEAQAALTETLAHLPRVAEGRVALRALLQVWRHMRGLLSADDRALLHRVLCDRVVGALAQEAGPEASALVAEARAEELARDGASAAPASPEAAVSTAGRAFRFAL